MKRWDADTPSGASFYSVDLRTENKDLMFDFFKERNVTHMPFIELYVGDQRVHSLVVPPSRVSFLRVALVEAADFVRDSQRQIARRNLLLQLRESKRALARVECAPCVYFWPQKQRSLLQTASHVTCTLSIWISPSSSTSGQSAGT